MDLNDAAEFLHVSPVTLSRWVRKGVMPPPPPQGDPFSRVDLTRWARERGLPYGESPAQAPEESRQLLGRAIRRGTVTAGLDASSPQDVIRALVGSVTQLRDEEREELLTGVLHRESLAATGLGGGVALPHSSKPLVGVISEPVVCAGYLAEPLDWGAPDGQPVHTALLLLSPSAPVHTHMLARIARAVHDADFVESLLRRPTRPVLVELACAVEEPG